MVTVTKKLVTEPLDNSRYFTFLALIGLLLPLLLLFVEKILLPYPALIEEVAKGLVVVYMVLKFGQGGQRVWGALVFVLVFAMSENIFYFLNFAQQNSVSLYLWRFFWPTLMHLLTVYFMLLLAWRDRRWIIIAMIITMAIHFFYNNYFVFWL
ncbi:MAG: PrsW family glutamic-type intramembrane protease [Patescibacteria group bacterium]|jgi:hypothetical protein